MKTAIVTDSSAYLFDQQVRENDIIVVPITVIFGQETFLENIDIDDQLFHEKLQTSGLMPSTTQITLGQMQEVFDKLIAENYDEVICIHLSSGITSFIENLTEYAKGITEINVLPFDSHMTSQGEANMVLLAAKLRREGKTGTEIIPYLKHLRETTKVDFMVDNLSFLMRSGRITNRSAIMGNLLRIKPILDMDEKGRIVIQSKERTRKRALQKVLDNLHSDLDRGEDEYRVSIIYGVDHDLSAKWEETIQQEFPAAKFESDQLGPVIMSHTGEEIVGVIWGKDWEKIKIDE
ncbi:DegV family protein [Pediococcus parvulus]|uniref:DegV family protein n=1 Tax=Pediococcus parvulus TaxID=54062 RepID=UPI003D00E0BC